MTLRTTLATLTLLTLAGAATSLAGPLTPPAGAITSTYKTLTEVEPRIAINATNTPGDATSLFRITQPGSYYLTGNITGVSGKNGVEIASSGVTLDLSGFELTGVAGSLDGVTNKISGFTNITVKNGSARGWGGDGIDIRNNIPNNTRVMDVTVSANGGSGLRVASSVVVTGCTAYKNLGDGIYTESTCIVKDCTSYDNSGTGISVSVNSAVSNCTVYSNGHSGISANSNCTITNCIATTNTWAGISASSVNIITGCMVSQNTLDGINIGMACQVRDNQCTSNGYQAGDGAGISAAGSDNRIEGNNCTGNDRGIELIQSGNIVIRNTCASNTTAYVLAANNIYGPILDRRVPASAAVNGFSAVSTLGSTDPNANFSY